MQVKAPLIRLEHVNVSLPCVQAYNHSQDFDSKIPILHDLEFCLRKGEHVAIIGANGSGKSSFLRLLRGELWPDKNRGKLLWHYNNKEESSMLVGRAMCALINPAMQENYVRQGWTLTGQEILLSAFTDSQLLYSQSTNEQLHAAKAMAKQLFASHLLPVQAQALSQGQLRLLLLGRALLKKSPVLLLDEYVDGLDALTQERMHEILHQVASHSTLVLTAHRESSIPSWLTKRLYMQNGTLQNSLPLQELSPPPKINASESISEQCLFSVKNATVFLDRTPVLHQINWETFKGEHWMLHGANGSGKSTLLRLLAGEVHAAAGGQVLRYFYRHKAKLSPKGHAHVTELSCIQKAVHLISYALQASYPYDITVEELILSGFDAVQGIYNPPKEEQKEITWRILEEFELADLAQRRMRSLSTGQLRSALLARALVGDPEALLLDEPFSGLDMVWRMRMMHMLEKVSQRAQLIFVSHYANDRLSIINRDAHMEGGRLFF